MAPPTFADQEASAVAYKGLQSAGLRHGDITSEVTINLKFLRDINNTLKFYREEEHEEMLFAINEDTVGKICKFHNISKSLFVQKMESAKIQNQ